MTGVVLSVPTRGNMAIECAGALAMTVAYLEQQGITAKLRTRTGGMSIDVARNLLFREFLNDPAEFTDLFFIDDDVGGFSPTDVLRFLIRLEPIIAGIYPLKQEGRTMWPCSLLTTDDGASYVNSSDGLLNAAELVPTGFMRIKRETVKQLWDAEMARDNWYYWKDAETTVTVANVFEFRVVDHWWTGEDRGLCDKWRAMGGTMWADLNVTFTHRGDKTWRGNFAHWHSQQ